MLTVALVDHVSQSDVHLSIALASNVFTVGPATQSSTDAWDQYRNE